MDKYYWSYKKDDEVYTHSADTIEDCIAEAKIDKYMGADVIYIGEIEQHEPVIYADDVIDRLSENAYDECGECSETWLESITKEEEQELNSLLNEALKIWMDNNSRNADFGRIVNVKEYSIMQ